MKNKKLLFGLLTIFMLFLNMNGVLASTLLDNSFETVPYGTLSDNTDWYVTGAANTSAVVTVDSISGSRSVFVDYSSLGVQVISRYDITPITSGIVSLVAKVKPDHIGTPYGYNNAGSVYLDNQQINFIVTPSLRTNVDFSTWVDEETYIVRIKIDIDNNLVQKYIYNISGVLLASNISSVNISNVSYVGFQSRRYTDFGGAKGVKITYDDVLISTGNIAPVVSNANIVPDNATSDVSITCDYDFNDDDLDVDYSSIKWFRNSNELSSFENSSVLSSSQFNDGDTVSCEVTAFDGLTVGNTISDTIIIGGLLAGLCGNSICDVTENVYSCPEDCTVFAEEIVYNVDVKDILNTSITLYGSDIEQSQLFYVGRDNGSGYLGVVDMTNPTIFGSGGKVNTGTQRYYDISLSDGSVWTVSDEYVQLWTNTWNVGDLNIRKPKNFTSSGDVYYDISSYNSSLAFVCVKNTIYPFLSGVIGVFMNSSELLEGIGFYSITGGCKSLTVDSSKNVLYVDVEENGILALNVSNLNNLTLIDSFDIRTANFWGGRTDNLEFYGDFLFSDNGGEGSIGYNTSNSSDLMTFQSGCFLPSGSTVSYAVEPFDESTVLISDFNGNLLLCEHNTTSNATLLYENTDLIMSLNSELVGTSFYLYASELGGLLKAFEFSSFNVTNNLPSFISGISDSDLVDNLNPISSNVTPEGLETPLVNVDPLCRSVPVTCVFDSEDDDLLFAVDDDYNGTFSSPEFLTEFEYFSTTYNITGNHTIRLYVTDVEHNTTYTVFRDVIVNVTGQPTPLPENYSTLKFKVVDVDTRTSLNNVLVTVQGVGSSYTDFEGETREVVEEGVYLVEFSLIGYDGQSNYYSTSTVQYEVELEGLGDSDRRSLVLTVKESQNNTALEDVFVQVQTPITNTFDYKYTDTEGQAVFYPDEDNVVVTAEITGYGLFNTKLSIPLGSTVYKNILLTSDLFVGSTIFTGVGSITGCPDVISGVLFCGYENVTCNQDSDCLSDSCDYSGHCSNFNWSLCDDNGMNRGNRCFLKYTSTGTLRGVGDWMLDNFFYVLIMVFLLLVLLIFALRRN